MADELAVQVARVRSTLPSNRAHIDAKEVERLAFEVVGRRELGLQIWADAREAAERAWRDCRSRMRAQYGARSPHGGWLMPVFFVAVLFGAFSAVLASGFRTEPAETTGILAILVGVAAAADLLGLAVAGLCPLNWAAIRMQIGVAVTLCVAAAFHLSRPVVPVTPVVVAGAVIGLVGLVLVLMVRAMRPSERLAIDNAINVAVAEMQPELDAIGARIVSGAAAELSAEERDRIVALRTAVLADLAAEGMTLEPVAVGTPAGAVIVGSLTAHWNPYSKKAG